MSPRWIGQTVDRVDGAEKVTGAALYTADLKFPRMLYAHVVRSPHAHARVLDVRLDKAARVPGVRAGLTDGCEGRRLRSTRSTAAPWGNRSPRPRPGRGRC